ncbi:MAG: hypothetical protein R3D29_16620 [Nitratireductor sp.]
MVSDLNFGHSGIKAVKHQRQPAMIFGVQRDYGGDGISAMPGIGKLANIFAASPLA